MQYLKTMKTHILIYEDLWMFFTYFCVFPKRVSCVYFQNAFLVCFSSLPKVAIPKNDDDKRVAQFAAISLGTRCPPREQRLLVSCSPPPHHVIPEGPLEEQGRNFCMKFCPKRA